MLAIADNKFARNIMFFNDRIENIVGNGDNTC